MSIHRSDSPYARPRGGAKWRAMILVPMLAGLMVISLRWALADAYYWVGRTHAEYAFGSKRFSLKSALQAESYFERSLVLKSKFGDAHEDLAQLTLDFADLGRGDPELRKKYVLRAIDHYEAEKRELPASAAVRVFLASTYQALGTSDDAACRNLREASMRGPKTVEVKKMLEALTSCNSVISGS